MSRTITVSGSDVTSAVRLDSLVVVEAAHGGEVGMGGYDYDDTTLGDVPAMKAVTIEESAATPTRTFTGYTGVRRIDRGILGKVENRRQWDVTLQDINTILDDQIAGGGDTWNRPEETDYARVTWLLGTGVMDTLSVTAGVVPNTNTVTMDAIDYRHINNAARRVLDECAEASGKNYFIYNHGSGHKLYYDLQTGTSLSSALRLSSVLADVDSSTTFAIEDPVLEKDPTHIYSTVRFIYDGGWVNVTNSTTESTFRQRETVVTDESVKNATRATNKANKYLTASATEETTFSCGVTVPAASVNAIRAGMRIEVKVPHLGISAFTWHRISRRTVVGAPGQGVSDVLYRLRLEFATDVKMTTFSGTPASGPRDDPDDGGDDDEPVDRACLDCLRVVKLLPDGMDDALALAFGARLGIYVYDGATMSKYSCGLQHIWTASHAGSNALNVGHEPVRNVPILASPLGINKIEGTERWDTGSATNAAASQDRRRYWVVGGGDVSFVAYDHQNGTGSMTLPAGWQAGDFALSFCRGAAGAVDVPAGYTLIRQDTVAGLNVGVAYRFLVGGDTVAPAWATQSSLAVLILRGVDTGTPVAGNTFNSATTQPVSFGTTTGQFAVALIGSASGQVDNIAPTGMTNRSLDATPGFNLMGCATKAGTFTAENYTGGGVHLRTYTLGINAVGGGGGGAGVTLERRSLVSGALVNSTTLSQSTTQIRATPNAQHLFVLLGANTLERYSRDLTLLDTVTITGFSTGLQDWNVDDDYNIYKLVGNVLRKYNRDGEQLWSKDLNAAEGYRFPTRAYSEGSGQQVFIDEHVRVAGYIGGAAWAAGSEAALLTVGRTFGHIRSVEQFGDDADKAQAIAVARNGPCLILTGAAEGSAFEDVDMSGTRGWVMRIKAALAE